MACNCQNSKDREKEPETEFVYDFGTGEYQPTGRTRFSGVNLLNPAGVLGTQSAETSDSQSVHLVDMPEVPAIGTPKAAGKKSASPSPILGPKPQNLDVKLNINYDEENHTIKLAVLINGENYEYSPMPISEFAQKLGIPRFDEFNHLERKG